jgi:UTP:GlnB (protein PII) uridylyltransferase
VAFLAREHLLLADTATRRDISGDVVCASRGRWGSSPSRVLSVLTTADAVATGPAASS